MVMETSEVSANNRTRFLVISPTSHISYLSNHPSSKISSSHNSFYSTISVVGLGENVSRGDLKGLASKVYMAPTSNVLLSNNFVNKVGNDTCQMGE